MQRVIAYVDGFNLYFGLSDLTTPVKRVREHFPGKRVVIALPPKRRSHQLTSTANGFFTIGEAKLRQNQLADEITTASEHVFMRLVQWR